MNTLLNEDFTAQERAFQEHLVSATFLQHDIHQCLQTIDELLDRFLDLKETFGGAPEKRMNLLIQLQLLQAKNSSLSERCFTDEDSLARFFFLHERMNFLYEHLSNAPISPSPQQPATTPDLSEQSLESTESEVAFECPVCLEMCERSSEFQRLEECGHEYCNTCLHQYLEGLILGGADLSVIACMDPNCHGEATESDIRGAINGELLAKYERFSLLQFISNDPHSCWCTFPGCDTALAVEGATVVRCTACFRSSCVSCKTAAHSGMSCKENQANRGPEDDRTAKWKRKHGVKSCPHCGTATIRVSGCPDMICSTCHLHWDWNRVGQTTNKETRLEKLAYFYPRLMREVVGSRDTVEDWNVNKGEVLLRLVPWTIAVSLVGVPLSCITAPPAILYKRLGRKRRA